MADYSREFLVAKHGDYEDSLRTGIFTIDHM